MDKKELYDKCLGIAQYNIRSDEQGYNFYNGPQVDLNITVQMQPDGRFKEKIDQIITELTALFGDNQHIYDPSEVHTTLQYHREKDLNEKKITSDDYITELERILNTYKDKIGFDSLGSMPTFNKDGFIHVLNPQHDRRNKVVDAFEKKINLGVGVKRNDSLMNTFRNNFLWMFMMKYKTALNQNEIDLMKDFAYRSAGEWKPGSIEVYKAVNGVGGPAKGKELLYTYEL